MDLVFFLFTEKWWDWERQGFPGRTATLARALASHPGVSRMLVVDTPTSLPARLTRGERRRGERVRDAGRLRRVGEKLYVLDQLRLLPAERHHAATFAANSAIHDIGLRRALVDAVRRLAMDRPTVWLSGPTVAKYAHVVRPGFIVYDAVDEWLAHPGYARIARDVSRGYDRIMREADLVYAVTPTLARRFEGGRPCVEVLPNAVSPRLSGPSAEEPSQLAGIPRPRVAYVGVLQDRLDVALVSEMARRLPRLSFVFAGPVADETHIAPLRELPNVHLVGAVRPDEIDPLLRACDACILPHVDTELTRNMDPVKLYEYVASGRPVVASDLPGLMQPHSLVRRAAGADEWVACIADATSGAWQPDPAEVEAYVNANTWDVRAEAIVERLSSAVRGSSAQLSAAGPAGGWVRA